MTVNFHLLLTARQSQIFFKTIIALDLRELYLRGGCFTCIIDIKKKPKVRLNDGLKTWSALSALICRWDTCDINILWVPTGKNASRERGMQSVWAHYLKYFAIKTISDEKRSASRRSRPLCIFDKPVSSSFLFISWTFMNHHSKWIKSRFYARGRDRMSPQTCDANEKENFRNATSKFRVTADSSIGDSRITGDRAPLIREFHLSEVGRLPQSWQD